MNESAAANRSLPQEAICDSPTMVLWRWSIQNGWPFLPADELSDCYVSQDLVAVMFSTGELKTARNKVLKGVPRHHSNVNLVRYGDIISGIYYATEKKENAE